MGTLYRVDENGYIWFDGGCVVKWFFTNDHDDEVANYLLDIKISAQKKIYFWWIEICYDPNKEVGQRMQERKWLEFDKLQKSRVI